MSKGPIKLIRDEEDIQPNSIMDWLDKFVFGPMNWLEIFLFRWIKQTANGSKGGRYGPMFQVVIPRVDKGGRCTFSQVRDHLEDHGVRTFRYCHSDQSFFLSVRETQRSQVEALTKGGELTSFGRKWKDGPRQQPDAAHTKQSIMDRIF